MVTERKPQEDSVKVSPKFASLERIIDCAKEGILELDADGTITYANSRIFDLMQISRSDDKLQGRPLISFVGDAYKTSAETAFNNWINGGLESLEISVQCNDSKCKWLKLSPAVDSETRSKEYLLLFATDITDHKTQSFALQRVNARLQFVLDCAEVGSWDWWLDEDRLEFDRRWFEMVGREPTSNLSGLKMWEGMVHADDLKRCRKQVTDYLEGRLSTFEVSYRLRHAKGHWLWILSRGRISERDLYGRPTRFSGIHFDLTEQKKNEAIILRSAKLASLGEMSGGIAHEINNPLSVIQMRCDLNLQKIKAGTLDVKNLPAEFEKLIENTKRISNIIRSLRGFARQADEEPREAQPLDRLLNDAIVLCKDRFTKHGVNIENKNELKVSIICRPHQICQSIVNLLLNSYDALADTQDAWIRIETQLRDGQVEIKITDSGKGISEEVAEKMFAPFFTTKEVGHGMGLGLSVAKGFIEENHGFLEYDITSPNTSFKISMPYTQGEEKLVTR